MSYEHKPHKTNAHQKQHTLKERKEDSKSAQSYRYVAYVSFSESKKVYTFGCDVNTYKVGDKVIVETIRGLEMGEIVKESEAFFSNGMEIKPILRKATEKDLKQVKENEEKAKKAMEICRECIQKLHLDMNLIEAEYTLDCSKIIFVYVADERVDFRELLKELASIFKCRIELRQIGPRNKSKIIGGLGSCGMETCCSRFLNDFEVISINMAKNQLLALNIQKLSGQCGKLMCCLRYEDSQYKKLREGLPKLNSQVEYKGQRYRITSMNVLLQQVKIENKEDVQFLDFKELWPDIDFSNR
ncbi:regulatory iron-sulfur-containing complex subunit RicT [Amedibacillus dolichus]|uniref:regulatory iron-sulfur-containing complex subunit RicT n=1 Tax=Amedibacillus dolichus TaxID=31971 RepID=UPI0039A280A3